MPKFKKVGTVSTSKFKKIGSGQSSEDVEEIIKKRVEEERQRMEAQNMRAEKWRKISEELEAEIDPYTRQAREAGRLEAFGAGVGKGFLNIGRGVKRLAGQGIDISDEEKKAFGALEKERPYLYGGGELAGEVSAVVPAAYIATRTAGKNLAAKSSALGAMGIRAGVAAGVGGFESMLSALGRDRKPREVAAETTLGAVTAPLGEFAEVPLRIGGKKIISKFSKKILKEEELPENIKKGLELSGLSFDDLGKEGVDSLLRMGKEANPEEMARYIYLTKQGYKGDNAPTVAQIKRTAASFMEQQEKAKASNLVRQRLENQNAFTMDRFNRMSDKISGGSSGNEVADLIISRAIETDNKIGLMYDMAEMATKGKNKIVPRHLLRAVRKMKQEGENELSGGLVASIESILKKRNIIAKIETKGGKTFTKNNQGKIVELPDNIDKSTIIMGGNTSAKGAENLIQVINRRYNKADLNQNRIARKLKAAIDKDVTRAGGKHLFKEARSTKAKFHRELDGPKSSKFTKRDTSLPRDILEEKIDGFDVFKEGVLKSKYRASDVKHLKTYLTRGGTAQDRMAGKAAWNNLRREAMEYIKDNAFKGPLDEMGNRKITRARFQSVLNKITDKKIDVLFNAKEKAFLKDMDKVLKILEPVPGTAIGRGPTAQAVERAVKDLSRLKRLGAASDILKIFTDFEYNNIHKTILSSMPKPPRPKSTGGAAVVTGNIAGEISGEEE